MHDIRPHHPPFDATPRFDRLALLLAVALLTLLAVVAAEPRAGDVALRPRPTAPAHDVAPALPTD